jgi:tetratricopeptide (TPR) repeat protein
MNQNKKPQLLLSYKSWVLIIAYILLSVFCIWQFLLPFLAERRFRDGYNFYMLKRYRYSIEELQKAIKLAPWETHYMVQLGRAYEDYAKQQATTKRKLSYWYQAETLYKQMIDLDRLNPWFRNRLALAYMEMARLLPEERNSYISMAEQLTKSAAILDNQNPLFQLNYASFLHKTGKLDEAKTYYEKVIKFDPRMVDARYNLADIYRKQGEPKKTLELYLEAFEIKPNFGNLDLAIASTYLQSGDKDLATFYLQHTVDRKPKQLEPLKTLGSIYYQNSEWEKSAAVYKTLITQFPDQYTYHQYYVQALVKLNKAGKAFQSLENHLQRYPKDPLAKKQYSQLKAFFTKQKK